jgi:hypothetical protein
VKTTDITASVQDGSEKAATWQSSQCGSQNGASLNGEHWSEHSPAHAQLHLSSRPSSSNNSGTQPWFYNSPSERQSRGRGGTNASSMSGGSAAGYGRASGAPVDTDIVSTWRTFDGPAPMMATTLAQGPHAQLQAALENMAACDPPQRFLGKYIITGERMMGGQAVVQFARGGDGGFFQFAIKYFPVLLLFCSFFALA